MHPRKTFFTLPNLFTLGGIFCGLFSLALSSQENPAEAGQTHLYEAAIAIAFGYFFDMADGRVARLTRTQSALGMELDSLADVITFGVAPAMLVYRFGLRELERSIPFIGLFIAFCYVAAAALRLARFNVLSLETTVQKKDPGGYIVGLPVPVASAVIVTLVAVQHQFQQSGNLASISSGTLAALVILLSLLQISRIPFRSFKNVRLRSRRAVMVICTVLACLGLIVVLHQPYALIFALLLFAYVSLGLFEEIVSLRRKRAEADGPSEDANEGRAKNDEEVLRELGAYAGEERPQQGGDGDRGV